MHSNQITKYNIQIFLQQTMQNQSYPTIKDFVLQEAQQRAFQTLVLGLKDYEKEKSKLLEEKKQVIHTQYDKKIKDNNASKRIHRSSLINGSRMKKMQQRHAFLTSIMQNTQQRILNSVVRNQSKYRALLKNLIMQGLIRMLQPKVYIRCLKRDQRLVESLVNQCKKQFRNLIQKQGIDATLGQVDLLVDNRYFLQQRNINAQAGTQTAKSQQLDRCFGGLVLTNEDGLIVCKNTLDARLQLAYQQMLPTIRRELFN